MSEPLPLSLIVITRDAAHELAECLASAPFAAEALVVDSGSSDDTVALARRCGARVVEHAWQGFGPQKNFAVAQARHDWVLCIDADERVSPDLAAAVTALLAAGRAACRLRTRSRAATAFSAAGSRMAKAIPTGTCGCSTAGARAGATIRCTSTWWPTVRSRRLPGDLLHASAESIDAYIAKQNRYTTLQAEALHAQGIRAGALRIALSPAARFFRFYVIKRGFLDGVPGFAHIAIGAFASFLKYVKLRALDARPRAPGE